MVTTGRVRPNVVPSLHTSTNHNRNIHNRNIHRKKNTVSHAIEIQKDANGKDVALAGYRKTPAWHVLGAVVDNLSLSDAGLSGWDITPQPAYVLVDGEYVEVDPKLGMVNTRTLLNGKRAPLAFVGPNTVPHQNEDLFTFAEAMLSIGADSGEPLELEAAGSLHDGRKVWILMRIPGSFDIGGDKIERWVCVETNHDGKGATRAFITYIRVVCWNTLSAAANAALNKYVIRHNGPIFPQMALQAREVLGLHLKVDPVLTEIVEQWQEQTVTDAQFEQIVKEYVPDAPKGATSRVKNTVARKRSMIEKVYASPTIGEFRGTKWGVVNALTESYQWAPGSQTSQESLAKRQMVGAAAQERAAVRLVDAVLAGA